MPDLPERASTKDAAEFVRFMLQCGRATIPDVIAWADSVIAASSEAPSWAIDLATSKNALPFEIDSLLQKIPGEATNDVPRKMVAAVLRQDWLSNRLSDEKFTTAWFAIYPEYPEDNDSRHAADVWQYLDEVLVSIAAGDRIPITLDEARIELAGLLEPYARFQPLAVAVGLGRCHDHGEP